MGGDIRVKSKEGRGSNFMIAFPTRAADEVRALSELCSRDDIGGLARKRSARFSGYSFLLLDDIPENMIVMREILQRQGAQATCTVSGYQALELFKAMHGELAAIVTDLRMSEMSGQTFMIEVRRLEREGKFPRRIPIIVVTAESSGEEKRLCLTKYGADEYLVKPIKYRDLVSAIKKVVVRGRRVEQQSKKLCVMVLEDDAISAKFLCSVLKADGHRCVSFGTIKSVITRSRSNTCEGQGVLRRTFDGAQRGHARQPAD